ncbi:MAG: hypothetical protein RLZZ292_1487 [Bacteroidota bacterium]|jgi:hypothetical protein
MKKNVLLALLVLATTMSYAQTDIKIRPIGLLFSNIQVGAEFGVNENFGVEIEPYFASTKLKLDSDNFKSTRLGSNLYGKYYFSPNKGIDGINAGIYINFASGNAKLDSTTVTSNKGIQTTSAAIGFALGYKWVSNGNFMLETTAGFGRKLLNKYEDKDDPTNTVDLSGIPLANWDALLRITVGYRFGGGSKK